MADKKPDFIKLQEQCDRWVAMHAARNTMYHAMERMVQMEWDDEPKDDFIKATMSPDPHNAIIGVVRLMTSTEPQISVARGANDPQAEEQADKIEKVLAALWRKANREQQWPVHYGACYSAALYSEVCIQVGNSIDNLAWSAAKGEVGERQKREAVERPFVYQVHNPTCVYPRYGAAGLHSVLHRYKRRLWEVQAFWGKAAADLPGDELDVVTYNDYWDDSHRCVWVNDSDRPILLEKHGLPFIPWVCRVVMGSGMYAEPDRQRTPMLYPVWKGKWWHRQNLLYSVFYSLASQMGWPTWQVITQDGRDVPIDLNKPGGKVNLRVGESVEPLQKMLIDVAVTQGLSIADAKMVASTLPRVVFGESPGSTMSYSAMNLLSQGGRLPLVPIEQQVGRALAEMFEITLRWIEHRGEAVEIYSTGEVAKIEPADINPTRLEVEVKLKADVPQDRLQLANLVQLLRQPGSDGLPLISRLSAAELLGFMQPGDEWEQVIAEAVEAKLVNDDLRKGDQPAEQPPSEQAPGSMVPPRTLGMIPPVQFGPQMAEPMVPGGNGGEY